MAPDDSDRSRPQAGETEPVPVGVQRLLRLAAVSEEFLAELEENPEQAAWAAGVSLSLSEQAVLRSITVDQLRQIASLLPPPEADLALELEAQATQAVEIREGRRRQRAEKAAQWQEQQPDRHDFVSDLGIIPGDRPKQHGLPPPVCGGIRPDKPPVRPSGIVASQGIRPDLPPELPPERPVVPEIVKGIRPTPVIATAAAALLIGGAAVAKCTGACDHLVGSDEPSASEPDDPSSER